MTASYFVIKNLIQNQLMGDKVIRSVDTHQQNTKFVPKYLYLSEWCAEGHRFKTFLAAFCCSRALLETGEITPLPERVRSRREQVLILFLTSSRLLFKWV